MKQKIKTQKGEKMETTITEKNWKQSNKKSEKMSRMVKNENKSETCKPRIRKNGNKSKM